MPDDINEIDTDSLENRLRWVLVTAWDICLRRIATGRITINKESSLQLHLAYILTQLGELACIGPDDEFKIELETNHQGKNIDIWCALGPKGECQAAIELKCFRKRSNRATDTDMYDVLKDISRLESYSHVQLRRFICLTDNTYYTNSSHRGHAGSVSIGDNKVYPKDIPIVPSWIGKWKDSKRDSEIRLNADLCISWKKIDNWHYLYIEV